MIALHRNWISKLHFHLSCQSTTRLSITLTLTFQNFVNSLSGKDSIIYLLPKFHEKSTIQLYPWYCSETKLPTDKHANDVENGISPKAAKIINSAALSSFTYRWLWIDDRRQAISSAGCGGLCNPYRFRGCEMWRGWRPYSQSAAVKWISSCCSQPGCWFCRTPLQWASPSQCYSFSRPPSQISI